MALTFKDIPLWVYILIFTLIVLVLIAFILSITSLLKSSAGPSQDIKCNSLIATTKVETPLTVSGLVQIGSQTVNGVGHQLIQKQGSQGFEIGSSCYMVNKGIQIITNNTSCTPILTESSSPTIGNSSYADTTEGSSFKLYAEGSWECNGACTFTITCSLFQSAIISTMKIEASVATNPSNWKLELVSTIVSISGNNVVVSQSGGLSFNDWNNQNPPVFDYYAQNTQQSYVIEQIQIKPVMSCTMSAANGVLTTYNANFSRLFYN